MNLLNQRYFCQVIPSHYTYLVNAPHTNISSSFGVLNDKIRKNRIIKESLFYFEKTNAKQREPNQQEA